MEWIAAHAARDRSAARGDDDGEAAEDALVWAITALMVEGARPEPRILRL